MLDDLDTFALAPPAHAPADLLARLAERGVRVVDRAGWRAIDAEERRRGAAAGRERTKLLDVEEMLAVAERPHDHVRLRRYAARRARSGRGAHERS